MAETSPAARQRRAPAAGRTRPAAGRKGANFLTQKLGPLPAWGWAAIVLGGGGLLYYLHKRSGGSSATTAANPSTPAAPAAGLGGLGSFGGGSSGGGFGGGSGGGGLGSFLGGQYPSPTSGNGGGTLGSLDNGTLSTQPVAGVVPAVIPELPALATQVQPVIAPPPITTAPVGVGTYFSPPEVISQTQQPQNQPAVNPNVSPAPVQQLSPGQALPPASGTGARYVTPEGYGFTYG